MKGYVLTFEKRIEQEFNHIQEAIVWIDVESSGSEPETDELLEVAASLTDLQGNKISIPDYQAIVKVSNLSQIILKTDEHVLKMHEKSGLWQDLWRKDTKELKLIDSEMSSWLFSFVDSSCMLYFGGNSITLDRNFLRVNLKNFYKNISHRSVDVTSLSIALQSNQNVTFFPKKQVHRSLDDVKDSISEYRYYMSHITSVE